MALFSDLQPQPKRIPFPKMDRPFVTSESGCAGQEGQIAFPERGRHARLGDYDDMFLHYITGIHSLYASLFLVGTLLDLFSTWRSMHQGTVMETT